MDADSKVPKVLQEARDAQDVDSDHNIQAVQDIQNIQDIQDLQDGNDLDRNAAETTDNHSMISDLEPTPAFVRDLEPSNRSQFGEEGSDSPPTMRQNPHSILKDCKKRRVESPGEIGAAFEEAEESSLHPPASKRVHFSVTQASKEVDFPEEETSNPQQGKAIENLTQAAPIELQQSSGGESKKQVGPKKENPSSREGTPKRISTRAAPTELRQSTDDKPKRNAGRSEKQDSSPEKTISKTKPLPTATSKVGSRVQYPAFVKSSTYHLELHQSGVDKPKRPVGRHRKGQSTAEKSTSKARPTPVTPIKQRASNAMGKQKMVQIADEADEMDMDIVPKAEEKEHECMGSVQESEHEEIAQDANAAADTAIEAEDEQKSWLSTCRVT
ncbi:MAG: hypothetical protein L6R42_009094 [Xanthoria sp. 1 TBL-2021]|nr:MAG: hypothetical protein L6R42_009094 [Xanthoria sp. 1 TBL-2021]